jgi:uncharacterized membrane protein
MRQATVTDRHIGKWLAGAALGALTLYLLDPRRNSAPAPAQRSPLGLVLGIAGVALLACGASHRPARRARDAACHGPPIEIEKTIRIDADPEQVYDLFANADNFPRFMSSVAPLTEQNRPRQLAWQSAPGADVEQAGSARFEPFRGATRVTVRVAYRPPAGVPGSALAALLGSDPKRHLDEGLVRMKILIERASLVQAGAAAGAAEGKLLH